MASKDTTSAIRQRRRKARMDASIVVIEDMEATADMRDNLVDAGYLPFQESDDKWSVRAAIQRLLAELPKLKSHA